MLRQSIAHSPCTKYVFRGRRHELWAALFVGAACGVSQAQCPLSLTTPAEYPVGLNPGDGIAADLNFDGHTDLAVVLQGGGSIVVRMGNGDGSFQSPTSYQTGATPVSIALGDFSGDGRTDLAVANLQGHSVSLLVNAGNGTFAPKVDFPAGVTPTIIVSADFNMDGRPDTAVSSLNGSISVLLCSAVGTFQAPLTIAVGADIRSIGTADFNSDGRPDLVVPQYTNATGAVSLLIGNGDGSFQPQVDFPIFGPHPHGLAVCDLNFDGRPDLAVPHQGNAVAVLLGTGSASFFPPMNFGVGNFSTAPRVADFNGDGRLDFAVGTGSQISILLGDGSGSFGAPTNFSVGSGANVISVNDLNHDGKSDLIVSQYFEAEIAVLLNGNQVQISSQPQNFTSPGGPAAVFSVSATGGPPLNYQWRRIGGPNGGLLSDNGNISGANSATLTIQPAAVFPHLSVFACTVTSPCGTAVSDPAVLSISPSCPADFNMDGNLDPDDLGDFINVFFAGCP